jgi:hypothetical protein
MTSPYAPKLSQNLLPSRVSTKHNHKCTNRPKCLSLSRHTWASDIQYRIQRQLSIDPWHNRVESMFLLPFGSFLAANWPSGIRTHYLVCWRASRPGSGRAVSLLSVAGETLSTHLDEYSQRCLREISIAIKILSEHQVFLNPKIHMES